MQWIANLVEVSLQKKKNTNNKNIKNFVVVQL